MKESEFWTKWVKPLLTKYGQADRIESSTSSGIPDVNWQIGEKSAWMELKVAKGSWVYFEIFQIPWHLKRADHSLTASTICIYSPEDKTIYLMHGLFLSHVKRFPYKKKIRVKLEDIKRFSSLFHHKRNEEQTRRFIGIITGQI